MWQIVSVFVQNQQLLDQIFFTESTCYILHLIVHRNIKKLNAVSDIKNVYLTLQICRVHIITHSLNIFSQTL